MKKYIVTLALLYSATTQLKADTTQNAPMPAASIQKNDLTDAKNTRSIQNFMTDDDAPQPETDLAETVNGSPSQDPLKKSPKLNGLGQPIEDSESFDEDSDIVAIPEIIEPTSTEDGPFGELPQESLETDIDREKIISDIPAKDLGDYIDTTQDDSARSLMESKKQMSSDKKTSPLTDTKEELLDATASADANEFLPKPTVIGGWTGLADTQKKTIKKSPIWRNLKADHSSATDPDLYRLYLAETNKKEETPAPSAAEKQKTRDTVLENKVADVVKEQKDSESTKESQDKVVATPEDLYVKLLHETKPHLTAVQLEGTLEEFRESLGIHTKSFEDTNQDASDFSNTLSIAPTKKSNEPIPEKTTSEKSDIPKNMATTKEEPTTASKPIEPFLSEPVNSTEEFLTDTPEVSEKESSPKENNKGAEGSKEPTDITIPEESTDPL